MHFKLFGQMLHQIATISCDKLNLIGWQNPMQIISLSSTTQLLEGAHALISCGPGK